MSTSPSSRRPSVPKATCRITPAIPFSGFEHPVPCYQANSRSPATSLPRSPGRCSSWQRRARPSRAAAAGRDAGFPSARWSRPEPIAETGLPGWRVGRVLRRTPTSPGGVRDDHRPAEDRHVDLEQGPYRSIHAAWPGPEYGEGEGLDKPGRAHGPEASSCYDVPASRDPYRDRQLRQARSRR